MSATTTSPRQPGLPDALVVLGCRVEKGRPSPALLRRLMRAREAHATSPQLPVIMSGGKLWQGRVESEIMARWWTEDSNTETELILENRSLTTRQNAREVGRLCRRLGYHHVLLTTCDFHMSRARRLFESQALRVTCVTAHFQRSAFEQCKMYLREQGASLFDAWQEKNR